MLVFGGTSPIGNLLAGRIVERYGGSAAFMITGVAAALLVGVIVLMERRNAAPTESAGVSANR